LAGCEDILGEAKSPGGLVCRSLPALEGRPNHWPRRPSDVLTYEILEKVYDCTLMVDQSSLGDFPRITLVPGKFNPFAGSGNQQL